MVQGTQQDAAKLSSHVAKSLSGVIDDEAISIVMADMPDTTAMENSTTLAIARGREGDMNGVSSLRKRTLSEREVQILVGLVNGHANKAIARICNISEATVKVHMKSILRKIRVANRTQAAVWALGHGYSSAQASPKE